MDKSARILEIGCNSGNQLIELQKAGFSNLTGVDVNEYAIDVAAKALPKAKILKANIFELPFEDNSFDLVFTSGVLIHISPKDIGAAMKEIHRVAGRYIWGFEYFNEEYFEINYRGISDLLWKADFVKEYLKNVADLKVVKRRKFKFLYNDNVNEMFLLEKPGKS